MVILGVDEVGRGCWAGPLVAGAVILARPIRGLKDSKQLTRLQRNRLAEQIYKRADATGLGWVWPEEIDEHGLTWAIRTAMERAIAKISAQCEEIIIDGNINYLATDTRARAVIKADCTVPCVSAASIIAKVARDEFMANLDARYAAYGFAKHVGYGTPAHIAALRELGVSDIHRKRYKPIQAMLGGAL